MRKLLAICLLLASTAMASPSGKVAPAAKDTPHIEKKCPTPTEQKGTDGTGDDIGRLSLAVNSVNNVLAGAEVLMMTSLSSASILQNA